MKKMIYYYPNPLSENPNSGSSIRPVKMLQAFKSIGYDVELIQGYSKERKQQIKKISNSIRKGVKYDFVYAENTNLPTILSDKHHLPLNPFFDLEFFRLLNKYKIPSGLFYRDIYWNFEVFDDQYPIYKRIPSKLIYNLELFLLKKYVSIFYLPSIEMLRYVPFISKPQVRALPPAYDSDISVPYTNFSLPLKLLYVGGISDSYQMQELFKCVSKRNDVELTICTRKNEWSDALDTYGQYLSKNINIVHKSGKELMELFKCHHLSLMFFYPDLYREFAVPVKLYEYMFWEKPVIASEGTLVGKLIKNSNIGWVINYKDTDLNKLLDDIIRNPLCIDEKILNCRADKIDNTWQARATQVISELKKP